METLGTILMVIGLIGVGFCTFWLLIVAFQQSPLWGLGCVIPGVATVFVIMHWKIAAKPLLASMACIIPIFVGVMIGGTLK